MDDSAMTCSDFVNALKMLICSEKLYRQLNETLSAEQFSANFDIWYDILSPIIRFRD